MKTKLTLTIIGGLLVLQGILFFAGAEQITTQAFAENELSADALAVGSALHRALGSVALGVGLMILLLRNIEGVSAVNLCKGIIAMSVIVLSAAFYEMSISNAKPPIPALVLFGLFIALSALSINKQNAHSTN